MADVPVFEIFCCRSSTDGTGTDVTSRSILHPESPWDLVLWSPGATGLHIHVQLWLLPCYFPNTLVSVDVCWYRSMKQVFCDGLYFAWFMIV